MEGHKISIIVPIYNSEKYIGRCIESIISQTFRNWELILVDDGSNDKSYELCRLYESRDTRIKSFTQTNQGVSSARNEGLKHVTGQYVCFVDSDDYIMPEFLEDMFTASVKNDADLTICGFKQISKKGVKEFSNASLLMTDQDNIVKFCLQNFNSGTFCSVWSKLYRSDMLPSHDAFDKGISLGEDLKFNIEYFSKTKNICVLNKVLYCYTSNCGSLTNTYKLGHYENMCEICSYMDKYVRRVFPNINDEALVILNFKLFSYCVSFMYQNIGVASKEEEKLFIRNICNNQRLQKALLNLPSLPLTKKLFVTLIKSKNINLLYLLSWAAYNLKRFAKKIGVNN